MVKIQKTWETVFFTAAKGNVKEEIELNMNHGDESYTLCNGHKESVSFENRSPEELKLMMSALKVTTKYISENLFDEA